VRESRWVTCEQTYTSIRTIFFSLSLPLSLLQEPTSTIPSQATRWYRKQRIVAEHRHFRVGCVRHTIQIIIIIIIAIISSILSFLQRLIEESERNRMTYFRACGARSGKLEPFRVNRPDLANKAELRATDARKRLALSSCANSNLFIGSIKLLPLVES